MNASDERGIDVVRNRIKDFARRSVAAQVPGGGASLKVIILDEADAMTGPAQAALRRTMEKESTTTRFFLICNYISRIIEPLTSRCAKFRFKPLSVNAQRERLLYICEKESVQIQADAIDELIDISGGDLRKSITILQSIASSNLEITKNEVRDMSGYVPDEVINQFMAVCQSTDFKHLIEMMNTLRREGYGAYQLINQLSDVILENESLSPLHKAKIFDRMGECEARLLDGANEYLQLFDLAAVLHDQFQSAY